MAFAAVGTIGSGTSKTANQTGGTLTLTAQADAGNLIVLVIAVDNSATTDQDESAVSGLTDSAGGNTWTKIAEFTNSDGGAQNGSTCSVWYSVLTNTISSGGTISWSYSNSTSRDASAYTAHEFTKGASTTVEVFAGSLTAVATETNATDSTAITGDGTTELLRIGALSAESNSTTTNLSVQNSYSSFTQATSTGGGAAGNVMARGWYKISTETNSNFAGVSPGDFSNGIGTVRVCVGLYEVSAAPKSLAFDSRRYFNNVLAVR